MVRTPLAKFIDARLLERGQTAEEFAVRVGISPSGLYKFLRGASGTPRHNTLERIAIGLGMRSVAELLAFQVEPGDSDDPIERGIRERLPQMREMLDGIPRAYWGTIISKVFDRAIDAIDSARDMAQLLTDSPTTVTNIDHPPVTEPNGGGNRGESAEGAVLPIWQQGSVLSRRLVLPATS